MNPHKFEKLDLKSDAALVLAAFGTTSRSTHVYQKIENTVKEKFPNLEVRWAYTSDVIRKRKNLPGVLETLSLLERDGYRKVIVQPLHVFPGTEYRSLEQVCGNFPGIRIAIGETLMHRWKYVERLLNALSEDFLDEGEGWNLVIGHGSPLSTEPANMVYLGVEMYCRKMYGNVRFSTLDGMPNLPMLVKDVSGFLSLDVKRKVRIFPFMMVAGKHVEEDLLEDSGCLKDELEKLGFDVDVIPSEESEKSLAKALGEYPVVSRMLLDSVQRQLDLIDFK